MESATGIAPVTSVRHTDVSLQHFAGLVVSLERTPAFANHRGLAMQRPVTRSSHPLESNQNLSVFSRARNRVRQSGSTSAVHACLGGTGTTPKSSLSIFNCQRAQQSRSAKIWSQIRSSKECRKLKGRRGFPGRPCTNHILT